MTTYEIIDLAEQLKRLNNKDTEHFMYHLNSGYRIDATIEESGCWSVYLDEYDAEEEQWVSAYVSTHSVYSMTGAIAEAIDNIAEMEKEFNRNR